MRLAREREKKKIDRGDVNKLRKVELSSALAPMMKNLENDKSSLAKDIEALTI